MANLVVGHLKNRWDEALENVKDASLLAFKFEQNMACC
jgi:hypothetical protein